MFDRRLIEYFDWGLLGLTILIGGVGIVTLYSAVTASETTIHSHLYLKQLAWYGIGSIGMIVFFIVSYKDLDKWAYVIYALGILLLICVLLFGKYVGGSKRWLVLGPISIQPSEIIKITVIIALSRYYSKVASSNGLTLRELVTPIIITAIPFSLILVQPDLGTAMLLVLIAASITLFVKIEKRTFLFLLFTGVIIAFLGWFFMLKGYQKQRIMTFLDPDRDPLGAGYHIIQSKIAIGSGMIYGKGFLKGTQNALSFLPEQHTDFIFSVLAEEWGLIGSLVTIALLLFLLLYGLNIAYGCRDAFGKIVCVGIVSMITWQVVINISMVMGLMPVVGVPLPFISYGGSSIVTVLVGIGILINVSMRRFMFE